MSEELKKIKRKVEHIKRQRTQKYIKSIKGLEKDFFKGHWKKFSSKFIKFLFKQLNKQDKKRFKKGIKKILKKDNCNIYEIVLLPLSNWKLSFDVLNKEIWNNIKFALKTIEKYKESYLTEIILPEYKDKLRNQ